MLYMYDGQTTMQKKRDHNSIALCSNIITLKQIPYFISCHNIIHLVVFLKNETIINKTVIYYRVFPQLLYTLMIWVYNS